MRKLIHSADVNAGSYSISVTYVQSVWSVVVVGCCFSRVAFLHSLFTPLKMICLILCVCAYNFDIAAQWAQCVWIDKRWVFEERYSITYSQFHMKCMQCTETDCCAPAKKISTVLSPSITYCLSHTTTAAATAAAAKVQRTRAHFRESA